MTNTQSRLRALRAGAVECLTLPDDKRSIELEMVLHLAGLEPRSSRVPAREYARKAGESGFQRGRRRYTAISGLILSRFVSEDSALPRNGASYCSTAHAGIGAR